MCFWNASEDLNTFNELMEYSKEDILAQLEKIISDRSFSRSKINTRLLRFLVEATLDERDIKEFTIGSELFGSKYDPIKWDNKVRVYVYHLRKKLDTYYSDVAGSNEIQFDIAKGQYKVQFKPHEQPEKFKDYRLLYILAWLLALASIILFLQWKPAPPFWKRLIQNDLSTKVIFGDYFTMETTLPTGGLGIIRDYEINSEQDLESFIDDNPDLAEQLKPTNHRYYNWMAAACSRQITEFFGQYDYPFDMVQISEWSLSQLEKENLVYFGQSKSMGLLKNILVERFPHYTFKSQRIVRSDPSSGQKTVYADVVDFDDKIIDFTVVASVSMPAGNELRFFLSDQDCGAISALQYFTHSDSIQAFYNRHDISEREDFLALFEVTGWHRKSYEMKFVLVDK